MHRVNAQQHTNPPTDEWLTVDECAAWLRIDRSTLYEELKTGKLPAVKIRGIWRINRDAVLAWESVGSVPQTIIQETARLSAELVGEKLSKIFAKLGGV